MFYLTFATDLMVLFWVLNFIGRSAPLKEKYQNKSIDVVNESSIFPHPTDSGSDIPKTPSEGSIDGDKDLEDNESSSGSTQN